LRLFWPQKTQRHYRNQEVFAAREDGMAIERSWEDMDGEVRKERDEV
jgi:hypothetical protein